MATDKHQIGTPVKWKWGNGWGHGEVHETYTSKVSRTIAGTEVTRNASEEEPAYLIVQEDGNEVLKAHSEIENA
jgi:hypothetical protein